MKKSILMILLSTLSFMLAGCNFIHEQEAEGFINDYYQAMIDEDYEAAFQQLHLYDYVNGDSKLSEGTTLTDKEARDFYLKKIEVLSERNYKLIDFQIEEIEYEDGHSFWHHIKLVVEQNGENYEWKEVAHLYHGKLLIGGNEDPYVKYRDGKMNFDIVKEREEDGMY